MGVKQKANQIGIRQSIQKPQITLSVLVKEH